MERIEKEQRKVGKPKNRYRSRCGKESSIRKGKDAVAYSMESLFISKEGTDVKFSIEFTAEEFENEQIEIYKKTKDKFQVDGFRRGKAPRKLIMQHYGEDIFHQDAVEDLLQRAYPDALISLSIEPIAPPKVDLSDIKHGEGFTATVTVATPPEFEVKDYLGVKVKDAKKEVTDEDVAARLESQQKRNARMVTTEEAAADGNTVNIDFEGSVDGEAFEGGTAEGHNLVIGSGSFIEGFEEQLVGKKAGEEAELNVTFPEEYPAENLAGKDALFKVKINEVKIEEKPELDDEFAKDVSEFDTLEELKADIRATIEKEYSELAEAEMKESILDQIVEANEFDVPDIMIEDQLGDNLKNLESQIGQFGMKLDQYFGAIGQDIKEVKARMRGDAEKQVKARLVIANIARMEGVEASPEDLEEEFGKVAEVYGLEMDKVKEALGDAQRSVMKEEIKNRKAIEYIYDNAVVESE
ncbi:MAG: trigger factor [Clostridiales Family XIII bacterium]|nr:trigger factor [Clostridiales Family XIII bacterium]